MSKAEQFARDAIARIESPSVRDWASTPHNFPIVCKMAERPAARGDDPARLATFLLLQAMGL
jgi:hypothetical protein